MSQMFFLIIEIYRGHLSIQDTFKLVPKVSTIERFHCILPTALLPMYPAFGYFT